MGRAIGTGLALVAIATGLIVAAVNPALDRQVIAIATGVSIGVIALAVTIATVFCRHLPGNNDAWVFW